MNNKADFIKDYILTNDLDCTALTETWLHGTMQDDVATGSLVPQGYKMTHVPRSSGRGGGVGFVFKEILVYRFKMDFLLILLKA